ncbi:MAG: dienelactone hydrolase family protein [Dehalococcoidia bacterium]|nr:dienelactone hydrolase family protein [Dehalococcoidia bacterium]
MVAETITMTGHNGDQIGAFVARPTTGGTRGAVVLIHHAPGWDDWYHEATMRFARRGYIAICPNLYHRLGHGTIDEINAKNRAAGGASDAHVVGDVQGAMKYASGIAGHNGKIGVIGTCSGGRHTYLVACQTPEVTAAANLWGGGSVMKPEDLTPTRPVNPVDLTPNLKAPLLGIFGNDDQNPTPDQVNQLEAALKAAGKTYEFHRYDGAPHGFFYYDRPAYRQQQAVEGWAKVWEFFEKHVL